jgi:hypothetical protein
VIQASKPEKQSGRGAPLQPAPFAVLATWSSGSSTRSNSADVWQPAATSSRPTVTAVLSGKAESNASEEDAVAADSRSIATWEQCAHRRALAAGPEARIMADKAPRIRD